MKLTTKKTAFLLNFSILFILLFLYHESLTQKQNLQFTTLVLTFLLASIIIFFSTKENNDLIKKQPIRITTIFIFGYIIVYFQFHIDYILGYIDGTYIRFWVNTDIVPKALALSAIGLVSFFLGYNLKKDKANKTISYRYTYSTLPLQLMSLIFLGITLATINVSYLFGGYGSFEMGSIARYSSILFELTFFSFLIQHIINLTIQKKTTINLITYIKTINLFQLFLIATYLIMIIISGDRGPLIYLLIAFLSSYVILTKWRISLVGAFATFIISITLITTLGIVRSNEYRAASIAEIYKILVLGYKPYSQLEEAKSISNGTLELATSIRTLHNAVSNVPSNDNYFFGKLQALELITIFPLGQKILKDLLNIEDYKLSSEGYITYLIGGENGTEGSSCVADLYLDFGLYGVLIGMLFFGFFVRKIEMQIFSESLPSIIVLCSYMVFCAYAIYIPRSAIILNIRNIVWVFLLIKISNLLSKKRVVKK